MIIENLRKVRSQEDLKTIFSEDIHEISISMRNLLIFFGRSHEDFVKKRF